jgi:hypothetical protein
MKGHLKLHIISLSFMALTGTFGQKNWLPINDNGPWNPKIHSDAEPDPQSMRLIDDLANGVLKFQTAPCNALASGNGKRMISGRSVANFTREAIDTVQAPGLELIPSGEKTKK